MPTQNAKLAIFSGEGNELCLSTEDGLLRTNNIDANG
jgi:hypothetical protein